MPETLSLRETTAASLSEAATGSGGRVLLRLIAPGWSANGRYYSEDLLKGDGLRAFREGVHTYLDHPSRTENVDRPERSVRDLVGALSENAYFDPSGPTGPGLYAHATVRDEYRPLVGDLAPVIGMSIRADGTGHHGEAEGRQGTIVDSIESASSVDYVTTPAAGGRVVQLIESVQNPTREVEHPTPVPLSEARNAAQWFESHIHLDFTRMADSLAADGHLTREERIALSGAIGEALNAFNTALSSAAPQLAERDPFASPDPAPVSATEATEQDPPADTDAAPSDPAPAVEADAPTDPPAETAGTTADPSAPIEESTSPSEEDTMTGTPGAGTAPQQTPRSLMEAEISNMRRENAELRARERARTVIAGVLSEGWLVPAQITTLTESMLTNLPLTDDLQLDETELTRRAEAARTREEQVGFQYSEALGVGRPRDLGYQPEDGTFVPAEQHTSQLEETFRSLGMSESAAKIAAKGR